MEKPVRAHPRSRGENICSPCMPSALSGSSPLTRGKQIVCLDQVAPERLIPAHAGKTRPDPAPRRLSAAHPRSRGENEEEYPRVARGLRLIPAHAGKTRFRPDQDRAYPAHPRSRGENVSMAPLGSQGWGSSPLTRGKHFLTCAFTAQIDQILETLELAVSSGSYLIWVACATDAPQDPVRSIGLVLPSSRGAS